MICLECGNSYDSTRGFHLHIGKAHGPIGEYYVKHFPRFDLATGLPIVFKDYDDYFERDFNSKESFAHWCQTESPEKVREYVINALEKRLRKKATEFIPSHLELKSIFLPSWFGLTSIFGNKANAIKALSEKFKLRYDYTTTPTFSDLDPEILIDTREQYPLHFPNSKKMKLSCGDYSTSGELYSDVFVERKSLADLVSTLSSGKERFLQEILRAKALNYYLVVVVEDEFTKAQNWSPSNSFSKVANGKYILFTIRKILGEHDNIQFVFSDNRQNSIRIIKRIFQMRDQVKRYDLEYLKDFNIL